MLTEYKSLFKNKNFVYLWFSHVLSQFTLHTMNFLFLIKLFDETQSAIAVSFLWVAYALPPIFIGMFTSVYADIVSRKKLLIAANLVQSLILFTYAYTGHESIFIIYGIAFLYSVVDQFYIPAELASIPDLIKADNYSLANGMFFITQSIALIIGFSIAGVFNHAFGFTHSLYICSGLLFLAFLSVTRLPTIKPTEKLEKTLESYTKAIFSRLNEGYVFIKSHPKIYVPFISFILLQTLSMVVIVTAPILAVEVFHVSLDLGGTFVAAPVGLGAMVGAILVSKLLKTGTRKMTSLKIASLLFVGTFSFVGLIVSYFNPLLRNILGLAAIFLTGVGFVAMLIPLQTYLQEVTPGGYRGRVFGNYWFLTKISTVIPVILSGTITDIFGIRTLLVLMAGIFTIAYLGLNKYGEGFVRSKFK